MVRWAAVFVVCALAASLPATSWAEGDEWKEESFDVIVVGAGMSGLTAAHTLATGENPLKVLVLEARNRTGGRLWSYNTGWPDGEGNSIMVDLGGSWIHGVEGNPLMRLVNETNTELVFTDVNGPAQLMYDGRPITAKEEKKMMRGLEKMAAAVERQRETGRDDLLIDILDRVVSKLPKDSPEQAGAQLQVAFEENDQAMDAWNMGTSYTFHNQYGDDWAVMPKGYASLFAALKPEDLDIRLNMPVVRVEYSKDNGTKVFTADGKSFSAKRLVLTLPLGVIQQDTVSFSPVLPKDKRRSIDALGQGHFHKLWIMFPKAFWNESAIWITRVPINNDVESTEAMWESPAYGVRNMVQYVNFVPAVGKPVLLAINNGRYAEMLDMLGPEVAIAEALSALRSMYGEDNVPEPDGYVASSWATDPWARGAYGYLYPGSNTKDANVWSQPVDNVLFFAGDGTTDLNAYYAHGAYETGLRAAAQVLQSLGYDQPEELLTLGLDDGSHKH